jgi:ferrous iron transport protein A
MSLRSGHMHGGGAVKENGAMSLADLRDGQEGSIVALHGGHGFVGRMAALGFTLGARVRIVRNPSRGPIIVSVLDTQIALGRGQADHVLVKES